VLGWSWWRKGALLRGISDGSLARDGRMSLEGRTGGVLAEPAQCLFSCISSDLI